MRLFDFAYKNVSRDFKTYTYHFLSCMFSVFVFFIFTNLAFHPSLQVIDKNSSLGLVLFLGLFVSIVFSFVFILYSISNFLKQRSRQFAVLNIIGASNKQLKKIIFYENGIISILSLAVGMLLGFIFSKFFLMLAEKFIVDLDLYFYVPVKSFLVTTILMGGLFVLILLIAPIVLRKKKIIELLKKEDEAEKSYIWLVAIILLIILPVTTYLHIKEELYVYPLYLINYILAIYFVFNLIFIGYSLIMKITNKKFKQDGLVRVSNFKYNINTNLKTMTINMMLFSIILSSLIIIVGAPKNVDKLIDKIMPYSYMYAAWDKNIDGSEQAEKIKNVIKDEEGFKSLQIDYINFRDENTDIVISNSMYNKIAEFLAREKISLNSDEYFMVGTDGKHVPRMGVLLGEDFQKFGITKNKGADDRTIALSGYFSSITILSDDKYEIISKELPKDKFFAFNFNNWKDSENIEKEIKSFLKIDGQSETLISAHFYYKMEKIQRSIVAYVGSILCISFLIGIASTTYSRLYSSSEQEIKKYKTMVKLGMKRGLIKKSLDSTIKWIFVLPFIIALFIAWSFINFLDQYTLVSYYGVFKMCIIVYCVTELILYFIIKKKYNDKILKGVYE